MNPYRDLLYLTQADWHGYDSAETALAKHRSRAPYYAWFTRGWLPPDRSARILDIGCGSGQFLWFLRERGYRNCSGVDLDGRQVELGRQLGLDCQTANIVTKLRDLKTPCDLIAVFDVLEHLSKDELHEVMTLISERLEPGGGRLLLSVPNAESPLGPAVLYGDLTHEAAFTWASIYELCYCHGLSIKAFRDPFPAPVTSLRRVYRLVAVTARRIEAARLRVLGLSAPRFWSHNLWAYAEKK
jgi:SAM-dependent methyltransferase